MGERCSRHRISPDSAGRAATPRRHCASGSRARARASVNIVHKLIFWYLPRCTSTSHGSRMPPLSQGWLMAVNYKIDSIRSGHYDSDRHAAWYAGRPWVSNYPAFMQRDIDIAPDATILALMRGACVEYADRVAFEL